MMNDADTFEDMEDSAHEDKDDAGVQQGRDKWVSKARIAYEASTDYIETSVRKQWESNLYNFQARHRDTGKTNNKIFRPKIRTSLRAHEAALAAALFTNNDVINTSGANPNDKLQDVSAKLNKALVQHRLDKTIPWFQTVLGAYQDTNIYGRAVSKTYWKYETRDIEEIHPVIDPETGEYEIDDEGYTLGENVVVGQEVVCDEPVIDLVAPENFLYDPNADWRNPISDSPYLIEIMPMFASDVLERMGKIDEKTGAPIWHEYSLGEINAAGTHSDDNESLRQARQGNRQDPIDVSTSLEHQVVWVHFNIFREKGVDMAYYTLGTTLLLSDPIPLTDYHRLGRDTYTLGVSSIEAHKNEPQALAELGENLQREANIIANQRIENVKLVLNKRYFIKRQGNVDLGALMRNVAGGGVMLDDPQNDVNVIDTPDVTGSSYAEQDRLNMDIDEVLGSFSQSTIAANRQLNETVGGMNLMANATNTVQEYIMRTFIETWVEPTIRNLVKLEQMYETDITIMGLASDKAGIREELEQYAQTPEALDQLIQQELLVHVNVGMGNTNPEQKLKRLMMAINTVSEMPEVAARTNWDEVVSEVYSYAGYGDGSRFIKDEEEQGEKQPPPEVQAEQMRQQFELELLKQTQQGALQLEQVKAQAVMQSRTIEVNTKRELELIKIAEAKGLKLEELRTKLQIESSKDKTTREIKALEASMTSREMDIKVRMGTGI